MRSEELADRLKNDYPENNKNKVALIDVSGRGGISHHVFMLGDALTHSGLDVTVLTTKDCEFVPEGSSLTVRKVFRAHHTRRSNLMKGLIYTISLFRIIGEIRRERPDIVHWQEIKLPGLERHLIACFSHMGIGSVQI